ncbi:MAG TPA: bifunctional alpha/beta hydrolase/OsmC family protein [Anaerolineae bacterium]|nr:bifunctional alpha/beta hydrolase/OsmC family protein [Anaerolineae bacterium]HMR63202.1 bifunctional alpha/beta hydrolase/OsmC family protein [Anaerolineae bacterium]
MNSEKWSITNEMGQKLAARLDLPVDGEPVAYALFAHCFTCTKNFKAADNISTALTRKRIAVLRFDFTGLGESEGDFADTNYSSNVSDLVTAAEFLKEHYQAPKILIGHSLGGTAMLQAAGQIPEAVAVVTIGSPCRPDHLLKLLAGSRPLIEQAGEAEVTLAGRPFKIKKQFLEDLDEQRITESVQHLRKGLLIFHSPIDQIVSVDNAADIFWLAKHPKSFISLDTADHLLSNELDSRYVGAMIETWARKYLGLDKQQTQVTVPLPALDNRVTVRTGREKYRTEILAAGHSLVADEPLAVGGQNLGPNPYDLLLAGLGACTSMTLRMYADHKGWPLETAIVRLSHNKTHAKDCEEAGTETGKVDCIVREIEVLGPLDEEQRARLLEIADRCPVHRTLHSKIVVRTEAKA